MNSNSSTIIEKRRKTASFKGIFMQLLSIFLFQRCLDTLKRIYTSTHLFSKSIRKLPFTIRIPVDSQNRLLLVAGGHFYNTLSCRLIQLRGQRRIKYSFKYLTTIVSQRHFFETSPPGICKQTIQSPSCVTCVAFNAYRSIMATSHNNGKIILYTVPSDGTVPIYMQTFGDNHRYITSIAFDPNNSILATGSFDNIARLWFVPLDGTPAICVAILKGHKDPVISVAFHESMRLLATGSNDKTVMIWNLSSDGTKANCAQILTEHEGTVNSVAFHTIMPLLATGSDDNSARLWLRNPDDTKWTCVAILRDHKGPVNSVALHTNLPLLVTGSSNGTVILWRIPEKVPIKGELPVIRVTSFVGHSVIRSVKFHRYQPLILTGSTDKTAKLWGISENEGTYQVSCLKILIGHEDYVIYATINESSISTCGFGDKTVKEW
jgi:WD40 repeat protein